ncbi:MAG: hypothetical protein V4686_01550 [Patescibacteria group bacterium]
MSNEVISRLTGDTDCIDPGDMENSLLPCQRRPAPHRTLEFELQEAAKGTEIVLIS